MIAEAPVWQKTWGSNEIEPIVRPSREVLSMRRLLLTLGSLGTILILAALAPRQVALLLGELRAASLADSRATDEEKVLAVA